MLLRSAMRKMLMISIIRKMILDLTKLNTKYSNTEIALLIKRT